MAKEISEDWSDILWSEKCEINMKDESSQKDFDKLVDTLDLYVIINKAIEKSGALGTCGTVVGVYDLIEQNDGAVLDVSKAKTRIDLVDVDWIYPLSWNSKEIIDCASDMERVIGGFTYVSAVDYQTGENLEGNNEYGVKMKCGDWKWIGNRRYTDSRGYWFEDSEGAEISFSITYPVSYQDLCILAGGCLKSLHNGEMPNFYNEKNKDERKVASSWNGYSSLEAYIPFGTYP